MTNCQRCRKKFPFFTIRNVRHPSPFKEGYLCKECYQPYRLVLEKYSANLKKTETNPKAAAWVALCCLLAAQRVNLVRTITAAIIGLTETKNSWEVCRRRAMELTTKAMTTLSSDSEGQVFMKKLLTMIEEIAESPHRKIPIQLYASVMGDSIKTIEYEAIVRSGISIDELNNFVASLPGHQWLLSH
jgi:hypothetical protein